MAITTFQRFFPGGVHPPERKDQTSVLKIESLPIPEKCVLPLAQHIGAPSTAIVKEGDIVKRGQKIADASGFVSVPLHAPISGTITSIAPEYHLSGIQQMAITIESDGKDEAMDFVGIKDPYSADNADLINAIKDAGIVGLGGAAFPLHVKLSPPKDKEIDTLVINAAECEPYLTCDERLMLEDADRILDGIKIIQKILSPKETIIGIEKNKPQAIKTMDKILTPHNITTVALKTLYPQGGEKQLIKALTGRKVPPPPGLPMDVGVVVVNVATAAAVADAIFRGKPLYERALTVSGACIKSPKNLLVRNGTLVSNIVDFCGGFSEQPQKIISGGPMMGKCIGTTNLPILKASSGLLFLSPKEVKSEIETACVRCGACIKVCPMNLKPCFIANSVRSKEDEELDILKPEACIECGSCSYVCPANLYLVQSIQIGKKIRNERK